MVLDDTFRVVSKRDESAKAMRIRMDKKERERNRLQVGALFCAPCGLAEGPLSLCPGIGWPGRLAH